MNINVLALPSPTNPKQELPMPKTIRHIHNVTTGEVYIQARNSSAKHLFEDNRAVNDHIKWAKNCVKKHNPDCYLAKWTMEAVSRGDCLVIITPRSSNTQNLSDTVAYAIKQTHRHMLEGLGYTVLNKR
jgi:hypothetical protein